MYGGYSTIDSDLKNHLLTVFNDLCHSMLKNEYTGYTTRSTMDIIRNLYKNYDRISPSDMAANDERLRASYHA